MTIIRLSIITTLFVLSFKALPVEERTYTFVGAYFPQISEQLPSGELRGLGIEITDMVARKMGVKIDIEIYPLLRAIEIIKQGKADGIIGAYKSEERMKFMSFTAGHFYEDPIYLYVHRDSKLKWNGKLESLKSLKIGALRGWSLGERFENSKSKLNVLYVSYLNQLVSMLELKRLDIIIAHPRALNAYLNKSKIKNKPKSLGMPIAINKGYFAFRKDADLEKFIQNFNKEYSRLLNEKLNLKISK